MHGAEAVNTSKEIMRNSSHSFSGLVSGTTVGWPFDGSEKPNNGPFATRHETFEVVTGRKVINRFRDKKGKKNETRRRKGLSHRRIGSLCTCQRCRAACEVQRFWRGSLGRRLALRVRMERDAARTIQNSSRRWLKRRQAAAMQIQRVWRGYTSRAHLHRSDNLLAVVVTAPVDDKVAWICATEETLEPALEPKLEQAKFDFSQTDPTQQKFSRLSPHYSYVDDGRADATSDAICMGDQLFLNGVSMAVQRAAAPLVSELSAEALHRVRERARQLKAHVAPVKMLNLADGVRSDADRLDSALGHTASVAVAGREWMPTRTSSQRPTSDPQLLSKLLLRSRSSRSTSRTAGMRRQKRAHESSCRPTSAPSSRHTSQCRWSTTRSSSYSTTEKRLIIEAQPASKDSSNMLKTQM
jgi:hypothetical protein